MWLVVKNPPGSAGDAGDTDSIPGSGGSPGGGNSKPLQCCCLENPMDRRAWQALVHEVTKSSIRLSNSANVQFEKMYCCSVAKSCLTLWDPMDCSTPGFPILHYLPEYAQTHFRWVSEAIQPSHPLWTPSPYALNHGLFPTSWLFTFRWPKYWSFTFSLSPSNEYSGLISLRIDWFHLFAVQGTLKSSLAPQFESINSLVLSLLYGTVPTSVHDYWKTHSFD